jgi:hypothetical protein
LGGSDFTKEGDLMANEMRDRLVELIQNAVDGCANYWAELIADRLIENGVVVPQWISVKERLPEKEGKYLCTSYYKSTNSLHINLYWFTKDFYKLDRFDFSDKKGVGGFWDSDDEWGICHHENVTHWMLLPEPPKKEGVGNEQTTRHPG